MRCKQSMEEPDDYDNDDCNDDDDEDDDNDDDDGDDAMTRAREMNQTRGRTREASQHLSFQDKSLVLKTFQNKWGTICLQITWGGVPYKE